MTKFALQDSVPNHGHDVHLTVKVLETAKAVSPSSSELLVLEDWLQQKSHSVGLFYLILCAKIA